MKEKLLLIDIGNSRIKYSVCNSDAGSIDKFIIFAINDSRTDTIKKLNQLISKHYNYKILISNVIKDLNLNKIRYDFLVDEKCELPFLLKYEGTFGSDRKCSLSGAMNFSNEKNILLVDFGSATTYNFISNKKFIGGMISTGLMLSLNSLISGTSLNLKNKKFNNGFLANDTKTNILNGIYNQQLFTFYKTIDELKTKYRKIKIFITGGNAKLISPFINKKYKFEIREDLVMQGLKLLYLMKNENHN
ncbi:MAG TPA: type III pantothenate kinase [Ignavibacteria bacterium]|nr:type III pantothenate kinase [Ignavibacteria bacterium]